jgi:diguanylate cyclase (GGDEF)-like protein/PAS domain S-box-containing protein
VGARGAPVNDLSARPPVDLQAQLEQALEQVRRLRMIIDGSAAGTWEWNPPTGHMQVNARWAEIVGYTLEELQPISSDTFERLVHPDDLQRSDVQLQAHFAGKTPFYECLVRMRHRNGHWVWVQDRGRVCEWDEDGAPLWMAGAHADVTDLQQARQDVAGARQRLQSIVDSSDEVAVIVTDEQGSITLFNSGAERLLGYRADEVVGVASPVLFHQGEEVDAFLLTLPADEATGGDLFSILSARAREHTFSRQWTFLRKDGQPRQVRLSISALADARGEVTGFVGMATDITEVLQARAEARLAEEKFAGAFTSAALGMALVSLEGRWLDVNDALCRIMGYSRSELLQIDYQRLTHPDDLGADLAMVEGLLRGERAHYHLEKRYIGREGNVIWTRLSVSLVRSEQGDPLHFVSQIQDVTAQHASEQRLLQAEQRSRITLDAVTDLVLSVDLDGRIEHANAAAVRALGGPDGAPLHGRHVGEMMQLTTEYAPLSPLDISVLLDPESNAVDLHSDLLLVQDGENMPVDVSQAWLHDDAGALRGAVWVIRDVTQLRARQREARQLAEMDPLTDLVNRRGFEAHLQQAIAHVDRTGQAASLMFIDLDQFKPVNDTWGHLAGDAVLWAVANVLRHGVRDSDVVARLGGDEFAVILAGCSLRRARRIAGELLHTIGGLSIPWEQHRIKVGVSIGIASINTGMSVDEAVAAADVQCYRAKAAGRNNVQSEPMGLASPAEGD